MSTATRWPARRRAAVTPLPAEPQPASASTSRTTPRNIRNNRRRGTRSIRPMREDLPTAAEARAISMLKPGEQPRAHPASSTPAGTRTALTSQALASGGAVEPHGAQAAASTRLVAACAAPARLEPSSSIARTPRGARRPATQEIVWWYCARASILEQLEIEVEAAGLDATRERAGENPRGRARRRRRCTSACRSSRRPRPTRQVQAGDRRAR